MIVKKKNTWKHGADLHISRTTSYLIVPTLALHLCLVPHPRQYQSTPRTGALTFRRMGTILRSCNCSSSAFFLTQLEECHYINTDA